MNEPMNQALNIRNKAWPIEIKLGGESTQLSVFLDFL